MKCASKARKFYLINWVLIMSNVFLLLIALLITNNVFATELADINQLLIKKQSMQGVFEQQKSLSILKRPLRSSGEFVVDRDLGIFWHTEKPVESRLMITNKRVYFSEQTSENLERSMRYIGKILHAILSGDLSAIEQTFIVKTVTLTDGQWQLKLVPKSFLMKKALSSVMLSGSSSVQEMTLQEKNGDYTRINLSQIVHHAVLPDAAKALYATF